MKYIALFLLIFSPVLRGETIDDRLRGYITKFNVKTLDPLPSRNRPLYDLGFALFMSNALSGNNNISCRDCHHPAARTVDALPLGLGEGASGINTAETKRIQGTGTILARNTPALFNLHGIDILFWDGRVSFDRGTKTFSTPVPLLPEVAAAMSSALSAQAIFPLVNHAEMRGKPGTNAIADARDENAAWDLLVKKILGIPQFKALAEKAFPDQPINIGHFGEAMAEFQRFAFAFSRTPYDEYLMGDVNALTSIQKTGMDVFFGRGKCGECHNGAQLSNFEFHNIAVAQIGPGVADGDDKGRGDYAFRVPPLRNVGVTAPYMHDGAFRSLEEVVEHYDSIMKSIYEFSFVNDWSNYSENIADHDHDTDLVRLETLSKKITFHLRLDEAEKAALTEFLRTALTDRRFQRRKIR